MFCYVKHSCRRLIEKRQRPIWLANQIQAKEVAVLAGIEPTTLGFGGRYSIH